MSMRLECVALHPKQFRRLLSEQATLAPDFILDSQVLEALGVPSEQIFQIDYRWACEEFEQRHLGPADANNPLPLAAVGELDYESSYGLANWWSPEQFKLAVETEGWKLLQDLDSNLAAFIKMVIEQKMYLVSFVS